MSRKFLVPIVLPADPANALEAATKQYVDAQVASAGAAASEVSVGPNDPIGTEPTTELWFDSDALLTPTPGFGIPSGGTVGQVLTRQSATDYDVAWQTKPSAGGLYGVSHYNAALAANTVVTASNLTFITIAMPAAPAGSLLDMSFVAYVNQGTVGTGTTFLTMYVNNVAQSPTIVIGDRVQLESYSARRVNVAQPVGIAYNITLVGVKSTSGGTIQLQATNTTLDVVSYRP